MSGEGVLLLGQDGDGVYIDVGATTGIDEAHEMVARGLDRTGVDLLPGQGGIIGIDRVDLDPVYVLTRWIAFRSELSDFSASLASAEGEG